MQPDSAASKALRADKNVIVGFNPDRVIAARRKLSAMGISMREFADRNGYPYPLVRQIMAGQKRCLRGKSHRIAVHLGLKDA